MRKNFISRLLLYRYRFVIGYTMLGMIFVLLLLVLPFVAQTGLTEAEIESATKSNYLNLGALLDGNLVNLPYRLLQKTSIYILGLTPYAIKLPSILVGLCFGLFLILLLNRWFKTNVSLLTSCLMVLSTLFLFLAGSGTPLIMLVFWPTLLLWLGSKIQGEKRPKPSYCFIFAICLFFSIFTPYMIYFAIFCVLFVLFQPHLRFVIKSLPKLPLFAVFMLGLVGGIILVMNLVSRPEMVADLLFVPDFEIKDFWPNIGAGLSILLPIGGEHEVFPAPLVGLPIFALSLIGLLSTTKGFFASRNSIASLLLIFTIIITGFNPEAIIFLILPCAILVAHGLRYILEKWYGLFPENPYARVVAILQLSILFAAILLPSLLQYVYGYHYDPEMASRFNYDLAVIQKNLTNETLLGSSHYYFFKILDDTTDIKVISEIPQKKPALLAMLRSEYSGDDYQLSEIITSSMKEDSDIIYVYTVKGE
ncbi:MAG: hypothetical protein Q4A79_02240 [Candidatus Saccharibacteria bacterium]|nr:hypothetical protein [Candidatus Saccharibacteria bacterium]